ncbi:MAG: mannitol dehydrogenase family protein [Salaquimonas sp.]
MATRLSLKTLDELNSKVAVPTYDRNSLSAGIIHVGIGNFHRAHQATYLHKLFETGQDLDWALVGAGVKHFDEAMRSRLEPQDWLTSVVELDPNGFSAFVLGSMIDFIEIDAGKLIDAMARPEIRIVSMTVTEGGYFVDANTGGFDAAHPDIIRDFENPTDPQTVFGIIISALMKRRETGIRPFTVMSCDNLPENGHVAKNTVLGFAKGLGDETHDWIAANVAFPNSMVDCITPATGDREKALVRDQFGIEDAAPVVCEPFHQWVMEDKFSNGRPALETVGVQFVEDVAPYELMKLRMLNGGHAAIAYPAGLLDIHYVHDAMRHPLLVGFLEKLEREEIIPTVPEIPGVSRSEYLAKIIERFSNEAVGDTIPRLCFDGTNRQPKFILPVLQEQLASKGSVDGLALESALWCRYCYGVSEAGTAITANDPEWDSLNTQAKLAKNDPSKWLEMDGIYGPLSENDAFAEVFSKWLNVIWKDGTEATLTAYITGI